MGKNPHSRTQPRFKESKILAKFENDPKKIEDVRALMVFCLPCRSNVDNTFRAFGLKHSNTKSIFQPIGDV